MKRVIVAVVILISLPALLALGQAIAFHVRNRSNGVMVSSGVEREYIVYVPKSYDRAKPTPLVISLHGAAGWPRQQMELSEWNELADREGFMVVYPSGTTGGGPRVWRMGGAGGKRDVQFISDLIDELQKTYSIDPRRIYANGMSNGGGMSFILSCRLSDRIAAVGLVGAAQLAPWSSCADDHAVPMIDFHGTADPMAPYDGGSSWVAPVPLPSVPKWAANWARRNRCAPHPIDSQVNGEVTGREYTHCAEDASVVLYTIRGGGHTWPGGQPLPEWFAGRTSTGINATREMWSFFAAHPLSATR
ncbi:MAG: PHB depolymerase family esterase [Acidobacteriota bacterium]